MVLGNLSSMSLEGRGPEKAPCQVYICCLPFTAAASKRGSLKTRPTHQIKHAIHSFLTAGVERSQPSANMRVFPKQWESESAQVWN